ncbi:succinate dehydrogenase, hydrophobic membrane anchor protein [Thiomicrospira microaerophila]|uniref:succinate dehydrogenase, hydrophobic membrane anchor protein n=1 Tax=Thiomicrospira microaerophila TaxID=406020 RepID=UPI00200E32E8|nr:succinate dehydrogenase, hydrophobic membrane anchor protein [Thiomicrospira microaerophila]UQB41410.1 succinate dehydrogenase, hydrophobic membrane anchor protein [Thiomicrospira microaerophila]
MKLTGKRAFVWQNISAIYLATYTPYLAWLALTQSIQTINDLFTPSIMIPSILAVVLVLIHTWVGLRDVMIDYAPRAALKWLLPGLLLLLLALGLNIVWLAFKGLTL